MSVDYVFTELSAFCPNRGFHVFTILSVLSTDDSMSVRYVFTELSAFCQQRIPCRSNNYVFTELFAFCPEMLCRWIMSLRYCPRDGGAWWGSPIVEGRVVLGWREMVR